MVHPMSECHQILAIIRKSDGVAKGCPGAPLAMGGVARGRPLPLISRVP